MTMHWTIRGLAGAFLLLPGVAWAGAFLLTPGFEGQDTAYYSFIPQLVRGQYNTMYAQTALDPNGFDHSMRTYLKFDLPEDLLEEGETVTEAYLLMVYAFSFSHDGSPPEDPGDLSVHRVLEAWDENALHFENSPPIGPAIQTLEDIVDFGTLEFDVTDLVRAWAHDEIPNHGFALTNPTEQPIGFHSWESGVDDGLKNALLIVTGPGEGNGGTETRLEVFVPEADFDRWMYPFNGTPGFRNFAPIFLSSDPESEFDNRDGTLALAFDTGAAGVPAGLGPEAYRVEAVTVTATHASGSFLYDGTLDPWPSFLPPEDPEFVEDADPGRPIEIHGVGLRNGYTFLELGAGAEGTPDFEEGEAFTEAAEDAPGNRNLFSLGFGVPNVEGDVSNSLREGFSSAPWAIGRTTSGLLPGDPVPQGVPGVSAGETFAFQIDVSDPDIQAYLQEGLNDGVLGFVISSFHETVQQAGGTNPNFYTSDNFDPAALPPSLELEVTLVPEPGALAGLAGVLAALALRVRTRRRD